MALHFGVILSRSGGRRRHPRWSGPAQPVPWRKGSSWRRHRRSGGCSWKDRSTL